MRTHRDSEIVDRRAEASLRKLVAYCQSNDWAGYDPYDALNSQAFGSLSLLNSRIPRLIFTQTLKRLPFNIRRLLLIPKVQNAKGIALFLSAFLKLSKTSIPDQEGLIDLMIERLIALRSTDVPYWCWGYSFPWQMRKKVVPVGAPNLVCTSFAANALLDAYERRQDANCLNMAVSAADYLVNELYWTEGASVAGFNYPLPKIHGQVHNANFLGAALLCRVYKHSGDDRFLGPALRVARHSASKQQPDGSWYYGEGSTRRWIDNFHTGFNLCALRSLSRSIQTTEFDSCLKRGFDFYRERFFRKDAAPRYFHNRTYPIDIHSVAQSIITLVELRDLDPSSVQLARSVYKWAMDHMWDDRGFFYYRVLRGCTNRIPYMRWSEAWMVLALATILCESSASTIEPHPAIMGTA